MRARSEAHLSATVAVNHKGRSLEKQVNVPNVVHEGGESSQIDHGTDNVVENGHLGTPVNHGNHSSPCKVPCGNREVGLTVGTVTVHGVLNDGRIREEKVL
jgi:hypothetical protein